MPVQVDVIGRETAEARGAGMAGHFRLGPVSRLFDLPAPEQSLNVQYSGQQYGKEIDGPGARLRPWALLRAAGLSGRSRLVPAGQARQLNDSSCRDPSFGVS